MTETEVGYANGTTKNPPYEEVCHNNTGHTETVKVTYDDTKIGLRCILEMYYDVINPVSVNQQGGDSGTQYRTGIYYIDDSDIGVIEASIEKQQESFEEKIAIEVKPLENYYKAEAYHQKYLDKNPAGYCHIPGIKFEQAKQVYDESKKFQKKTKGELKKILTTIQYEVTQNAATESPYQNEYNNEFRQDIYVDVTTGEPLFVSIDKFESGCGCPSFSKPISDDLLLMKKDTTHGMERTEVKSRLGESHLGHVFTDGSKELGGLRYCMNSASLRFIPLEVMEK